MARLADYVMTTTLDHAREAERLRVRAAHGWQLLRLGGVSGRTLGLTDFGAEGAMITQRVRAAGMRVMTVFSTGRVSAEMVTAEIKNLTSQADYLVLPPEAGTGIPDRRPIASADVVVLGPAYRP
jgi:phosphoglycerate dehydrogenase-like enzyme